MQSFDPLNHFFSLLRSLFPSLRAKKKKDVGRELERGYCCSSSDPIRYTPSSPIVVGNSSTSPRVQDSIV